MKVTKDLTEGNIWLNFLLYSLPLIGSALLNSMYSTVDAMIAGRFISEYALGAINATGSFEILFSSLVTGFAIGFSVYVAMLFGGGRYTRLKNDIVQTLLVLSMVFVFISACSILLRDFIFDYLKVDPILRADAETYFVIYTAGYIILFSNAVLVQILHALGVSSVSFYVSLISSLLNIGGNLLTVLVFDMGVSGLAISTLFSALSATVVYLYMLRRAFRELPSDRISWRFSLSCIKRSMRYTFPAAMQMLAYHGVGFLIAPSINGLGADATMGYTVATRMNSICCTSFYNGTGALGCHTSQCVGAGKYKKIKRGLWVDMWICLGFLIPFLLVFVLFAKPIASVFFPTGYTGTAFQYAVRFATAYMPLLLINMFGHLLHAYLRGLGAVSMVFAVSLLGSIVRFIFTVTLVPTMGMEGVFLAWVISWIADTLASVLIWEFRYRSNAHILRAVGIAPSELREEKSTDRT